MVEMVFCVERACSFKAFAAAISASNFILCLRFARAQKSSSSSMDQSERSNPARAMSFGRFATVTGVWESVEASAKRISIEPPRSSARDRCTVDISGIGVRPDDARSEFIFSKTSAVTDLA